MFIFFGTQRAHLKTTTVVATCPVCHASGSHTVGIYGRYAHVFWIPTFPLDKQALVRCEHCLATHDTTNLPPALRTQLVSQWAATSVATPGWQWIGLGLFGVLMVFCVILAFLGPDKPAQATGGGQFDEFARRRTTIPYKRPSAHGAFSDTQKPDDFVRVRPDAERRMLAADPAEGDLYYFQAPKRNPFLRTQFIITSVSPGFIVGQLTLAYPSSTTGKDSTMDSYEKQFSRAALAHIEDEGLVYFIYRRKKP